MESKHASEIANFQSRLAETENKLKRLESKKINQDIRPAKYAASELNEIVGCSNDEFE